MTSKASRERGVYRAEATGRLSQNRGVSRHDRLLHRHARYDDHPATASALTSWPPTDAQGWKPLKGRLRLTVTTDDCNALNHLKYALVGPITFIARQRETAYRMVR